MFKLNKITRTKNGELLKPFSVQGNFVLCSDKNGNTVKRALTDFDFSIKKQKEVISVSPFTEAKIEEEKNNDVLFTEEEFVEDEFIESVEEEEKSKEETTESIWDTINDGYL